MTMNATASTKLIHAIMTEQPDIELDLDRHIGDAYGPVILLGLLIVLALAVLVIWVGVLVVRSIRHPRDREGTDR